MRGRTGAFVLLGLGGLFVIAGLVIKFVFLPSQAQFPDDVDTTRSYEGTLEVMLNPQALAANDLANVFMTDVPVTIDRHVTTEDTSGSKALVREQAALKAPDGTVIQASDDWYTIDRKTMEHIDNWADDPNVREARQGLVIGFPIGTDQQDYDGWSDDYQAIVPLQFVEKIEREGITTYHFTSQSGAQPILDEQLLANFPAALPKALVEQLAPVLAPPEMLPMLDQFLPMLPDPVEFGYTYEYENHYWVEPTSGVLIDYEKTEIRSIAVPGPAGLVSVGPVWALEYSATDQSIQDAIDDAEDAKGLLTLFGTTIPYAAIGVGALLLLGGGYLLTRKREGAATE